MVVIVYSCGGAREKAREKELDLVQFISNYFATVFQSAISMLWPRTYANHTHYWNASIKRASLSSMLYVLMFPCFDDVTNSLPHTSIRIWIAMEDNFLLRRTLLCCKLLIDILGVVAAAAAAVTLCWILRLIISAAIVECIFHLVFLLASAVSTRECLD